MDASSGAPVIAAAAARNRRRSIHSPRVRYAEQAYNTVLSAAFQTGHSSHMKSSRNGAGGNAYSVPAIHRTLDIVEALVRQRTVTVSELHRQFKIPKSSAYAILQTLKSRGYVDKDDDDRYSLTLHLFTLGSERM